MKKILFVAAGAIILLIAVLVTRTVMIGADTSIAVTPIQYEFYDGEAIAERLGEAVRIRTISWGDGRTPDANAFGAFAAFLERAYPAAHEAMTVERAGGYSLIYRWKGADAAQKPVGFIAHMDVVPVEQGTEDQWTRPPFSGDIHDGALWGRGSLDDKGHLMPIFEAIERLAASGFAPSRDIYLLIGHDEELGGPNGAAAIAETLKARGVHFAFTLDEGSGVVDGLVPGVDKPVALISTAEKGSITLRFTARAEGGHSSAPQPDTAVSLAARAVVAASDHPFPAKIDANVTAFLHAIAPELPFFNRMLLSNLWLTDHMVKTRLMKDPVTAASLHTTTAPTMIEGGAKSNILPQNAYAIINYRIHPRDSVQSVRDRAQRLAGGDIAIEVLSSQEPSPQSSIKSDAYKAIADTTAMIFGPVPVAPSLTLQGTDSKHYVDLADDNYRFTPFIYENADLKRIHGTDEHVSLENLARAAAWYEAFIRKTAGAP